MKDYNCLKLGSGCCSVCRAVASNFRGPRFSSNPVIGKYCLLSVHEKAKIKKNRLGMAHSKKCLKLVT